MKHDQLTLRNPLLDLAERQHGLVTRAQVDDAGVTRSRWRHLAGGPNWEEVTDRVARRRGAPRTDLQAALAAVLDMGSDAYLSHQSAAALWGVPGFRLPPIHVMVTRGHRTTSPLATIHHPRHLTDPFSAVLDGIPVVRPALLVLQLASVVHPSRLGAIFDGLWSRRLLSGPSAQAELEPVLGRGRAGSTAMHEVLDARGEGYVPAASGLESRFAQIVRDFDLPAMRRQVEVGGERWCGRVDFRAVELPLVVEVDSDRYHRALTDEAADAARDAALDAAGFVVARVDEHDVWHRPQVVADRVRQAAWDARRGQRAA